jgi:hypothetical protein
MFSSTAFLSILPETLVLLLTVLILVIEPFWNEERRRDLGALTALGLFLTLVLSLIFGRR